MRTTLFMMLIFCGMASLKAQVSINSDGSEANASAMLDVVSTTKGILVPRMTSTERIDISSPANGLLVFDETTASFWFYKTVGGWTELLAGSSAISSINDLSDAASDGSSVFLGNYSGENDDATSNNNTAIGISSLLNNTSGSYNIGIGTASLVYNQMGANNTAIGYQAGKGTSIHNKSGGVFIGYLAGANENASNKLYIENSASSSPLIGGDFASNYVDINGDLNLNGSIKITGGSPGLNKILTSDASGNATWQIPETLSTITIDDLLDASCDGSSVFLGSNSGASDDGNNSNTSAGINALHSVNSGIQNVAFGRDALAFNLSGGNNAAFGFNALNKNAGTSNIGIGSSSAFNNTSGSNNVAIGTQTLYYNSSGNNNTVIGFRAGYGSTGHNYSGNVFLGYMAGYSEMANNKLYIENSNSSNPLIGGDFDSNFVDINGALNVNGNIKITGGIPGIGKVLTSDAIGNATWQNTGTLNIAIDDLTDAASDGYSVFLGPFSGVADDGANSNVGVGRSALAAVSSGTVNTAIGDYSAYHINNGHRNSAFGAEALRSLITGDENVSIGNYNLTNITSGSRNTSIGYSAGGSIANITRSGCVFIGYDAGFDQLGDNKLFIANSSTSNPLIGGDFSTNELFFNGTIRITGGNPGTGKILTSDASGNATWENIGTLGMAINDLTDAKTNISSVFLGSGSGNSITSGSGNTANGVNALNKNTIGSYNSAFGYFALQNNISGNNNISTGFESLFTNLSGSNNIATGFRAIYSNSAGVSNVAYGNSTLYFNELGSQNTAIGDQAGRGSAGYNVNGCVFIGYQAGLNNVSSNQLFIDNSSTNTPLIGGDFSLNRVDINGTIKITGGTPGLNKVLTSDANGNATWQSTATPTLGIDDLTDGKSSNSSVYLGNGAGTSISTGYANTVVGYNSFTSNTEGSGNTVVGYNALISNLNGEGNLAFGPNSLSSNTSGSSNLAFGTSTLSHNLDGNSNTAIGHYAGSGYEGNSVNGCIFIGYQAGAQNMDDNKLFIDNSNTNSPLIGGDFASNRVDINGTLKITGGTPGLNKVLTSDASGNATWKDTGTPTVMSIDDLTDAINDNTSVFIGTNAGINDDGANNNVGIGTESLAANITGELNTAIGFWSQNSNNDGQRNTSVGVYSLYNNISGNSNTAFGYYSLKKNTADNNSALGYYALSACTSGTSNVAVGFEALKSTTGSNNTAIGYQAGETITSLTNTISIGYNATTTSSNTAVIGNSSNIGIGGYANWTNLSDKRFKNQIKENVSGLAFIMKLRPVTFHLDVHKLDSFLGIEEEKPDMIGKSEKEAIQYSGFIAQEVEQAAQEVGYDFSAVHTPQNEKDHYSLAYAEFVVPLVKAVQEQQAQIEAQQVLIEQMQAEINQLKKQSKK